MGYSRHETMKKQRKLVSKAQRNRRKVLVNCFKIVLIMLVTVVVAGAGAFFGMMKGILDNAPDADSINIIPKGFKSVIYDKDGNVEKELSTFDSNREYIFYEDIPANVVNAFVAIEDERFWQHNGIDVKGILRAGIKGLANVAKGGQMDEGASTLTQQLIKNEVYNVGMNEITFMDRLERKIQEQYLAIEIEKKYTKEEIVEYYLNTIYLGRGVHGVQAASQRYFGKDVGELTISEAAAIAGITQNPTKYDPVANPEESGKRRQDVLDKMLELEYITEAEYNTAVADDVYGRIQEEHNIQEANDNVNTYYEDAILNQLVDDFCEIYGCTEAEASKMIYTGGYSIYSVQDKAIQEICDNVINDPSYLGSSTKVGLDYQLTINVDDKEVNYSTGHLLNYYAGLTGNSKYNNIYANEDAARAAADGFKEAKLDETGGTFIAETFTVSPQPQFAFTIIDQKTGYVKAMVGGRGIKTTNRGLNRATDSPRQPGSVFKVLAAYLPLIDTGKACLATPIKDEKYNYANGRPVNNWYGAAYRGYCTVRVGIRDSMNVLAVKAITMATPDVAFDYLLDLGFTTLADDDVDPSTGAVLSDRTQSAALGGLTYGVTTYEMAAAYAAIANGGVYNKPVLYSKVIDHDGNVIIDNTTPTSHQAMKATTAWQLIEAMKSVVTAGTGTPARMKSGITCAGKTGTTSSHYDLWFAGMSPYYTAAIWMGFDSNVDMGGSNAHKYMWRDIMDQIAVMEGQDPAVDFEKPEGITGITLCKITGKLPGDDCPTVSDICSVDFSPGGVCQGHEQVEICMDSYCVATNTCPNKQTFIVEIEEVNGEEVKKFADAPDEIQYTEEICTLHPEESEECYVTTSAGTGGSISPSQYVPRGSTATFYITPAAGYRIYDVYVNGTSVGAVSSYTISDIQNDVVISASFEAIPTETPTTEAPPLEKPPEIPPETSGT
ncbi:MAG: transglycosylase domain-containing protein [Lachnospiraceae bacterium]|nr:transglycosylase domain-containing protein [Lachnospiraceae bacterium]